MQEIIDTNVVLSFLKELPHNQIIEHVKTLTAMSNQSVVKEQRIFRSTKSLQITLDQLHTKLIDKQNSLWEDFDQKIINNEMNTLVSSLKPKYSQGDELLIVQGIEKLFLLKIIHSQKKKTELEIEKGIVYLIDIWKTYSQCEYDRIDEYKQMQERNPDWEGKVKIIFLSFDSQTESVTEMIKLRKCQSTQQYKFLMG